MSRTAAKVIPFGAARSQRQPARRRWRLKPGRWVVLLAFAYLLFLFGRQELSLHKLRSEAAGLRTRIQTVQSENDAIRTEIEQMNQDAYVERIARERLGLVKANETSYMPAELRQRP